MHQGINALILLHSAKVGSNFRERQVLSAWKKKFLARFQSEKPLNDNHFKGEILLRLNEDPSLPEALRSWKVGEPNCITYINVAKWESWEAFARQFTLNRAQDPSSNMIPKSRQLLGKLASWRRSTMT
jgi:hypothetical protein